MAQPSFKNLGVRLSLSLQSYNYSGQRRRGGKGRGIPLPGQLGRLGKRRKLPQRGLWRNPSRPHDLGAFHVQFYAISRIF